MLNSSSTSALLLPEDIGPLVIKPLTDEAVCTQPSLATVVRTKAPSYRISVVDDDAAVAWLPELAEIPVTDAAFHEIDVTFGAIKGLEVASNESLADSAESVGVRVGQGLARKAARGLEAAFFGDLASPAPKGLGSLASSAITVVQDEPDWNTLDPFARACSLVEQEGARLTGWIGNPADVFKLATRKVSAGSLVPLLAPAGDPAYPSRRVIEGLPLWSCKYVPEGTIYGLDASRTYIVIREDVRVVQDSSAYFSKDATAYRINLRAGIAFPHPKSVAAVKLAPTP